MTQPTERIVLGRIAPGRRPRLAPPRRSWWRRLMDWLRRHGWLRPRAISREEWEAGRWEAS